MRWRMTGSTSMPWATRHEGDWWVVRVNDFPDHPLHTLFVGTAVRGDFDDWPAGWERPRSLDAALEDWLLPHERQEALAPLVQLGRYSSAAGRPCDFDFCGCERRTPDEVLRISHDYPFQL